jgi:transcriptional regulator with XRE-family HTH domain
MLFGDELKRLRVLAELSQEALARKADVSVGNVRNYEQGLRLPSFAAVLKLSKALNVECTAFAECDDVRPDSAEDDASSKKPAPKKGKK